MAVDITVGLPQLGDRVQTLDSRGGSLHFLLLGRGRGVIISYSLGKKKLGFGVLSKDV